MVVSHERSGTHFLMNSIAGAYGYPPGQFLDFDQTALNINYFHPSAVAEVLKRASARPTPTVIKSHHAVEFFDGILDEVLAHMPLFYIHRDPVDVMISYWRVVGSWPWHEGPRRMSALEFAAAEPEGMMMRYQQTQARNLLHRWARHVDGWTSAAEGRPRLTVVRYDALKSRYEQTVAAFGDTLGGRSGPLVPPNRNTNVIAGPKSDRLPPPDRDALRALALAEVGDTMRRLGYA